jgi:hypothetical protein
VAKIGGYTSLLISRDYAHRRHNLVCAPGEELQHASGIIGGLRFPEDLTIHDDNSVRAQYAHRRM